jgi:hypothetical protein
MFSCLNGSQSKLESSLGKPKIPESRIKGLHLVKQFTRRIRKLVLASRLQMKTAFRSKKMAYICQELIMHGKEKEKQNKKQETSSSISHYVMMMTQQFPTDLEHSGEPYIAVVIK